LTGYLKVFGVWRNPFPLQKKAEKIPGWQGNKATWQKQKHEKNSKAQKE
jgi:hypothetical protein